MKYTEAEALQYIKENDVKFIRLAFCDLLGIQKNISVMPCELERAFRSGISLDAAQIDGFGGVDEGSLYLCPDPTTLALLPWRPMQGRVVRFLCDIVRADGTAYSCDSRALLKNTLRRLRGKGFVCRVGVKSEFYLFKLDDNGNPTRVPLDRAGYMDVAPLDRGENVRRDICLTLEEMGLRPESSHHEYGPGQNEIDFRYSAPLEAADNFVTFKWAVKMLSARNGAYASFMPKPLTNESGSGMHINISLFKEGLNMFDAEAAKGDDTASCFMAGILEHAHRITAALNPVVNSYGRLAGEKCAYAGWGSDVRQMIRIPEAEGELARMELRSPDAACNLYLALALMLEAGLDGVARKCALPPCGRGKRLPESLGKALDAFDCEFVRTALPKEMLKAYLKLKRAEAGKRGGAERKDRWYFETV